MPTMKQAWITGHREGPGGTIRVVSTRLSLRDRAGALAVRCGFGRSRYRVQPGIYAVGDPDVGSLVLVTANYKLTFDALRRVLGGIDAWILVLDTRGVNVWCAAGKGTFGTEELLARMEAVRLAELVTHRRLILPQLGATGVAAHVVEQRSGFHVSYGPVRAADLKAYLAAGRRKTEAMRTVRFPLRDRLAVTLIEILHVLPYAVGVFALAGLLGLLATGRLSVLRAARLSLPFWGAMAIGTVLVPALLPILPGRAFSVKALLPGLLWAVAAGLLRAPAPAGMVGYLLLLPAIASFLALGYTGSTTFTSLSGVRAEVRVATPIAAVAGGAGLVLLVLSSLVGGAR